MANDMDYVQIAYGHLDNKYKAENPKFLSYNIAKREKTGVEIYVTFAVDNGFYPSYKLKIDPSTKKVIEEDPGVSYYWGFKPYPGKKP